MKMAPPPRPVPHSTRSPSTRSLADDVEVVLEGVEPGAAHVRVGEVARAGLAAVAVAAVLTAATDQGEAVLEVARRVPELAGIEGPAVLEAEQEVVDAGLVLEVVVVEERPLQQVEVARRPLPELALAGVEHVVLEDQSLDPGLLGQLEERVPALDPLELVEHPGQLGLALQPLLRDHDGQPEVDRAAPRGAAARRAPR